MKTYIPNHVITKINAKEYKHEFNIVDEQASVVMHVVTLDKVFKRSNLFAFNHVAEAAYNTEQSIMKYEEHEGAIEVIFTNDVTSYDTAVFIVDEIINVADNEIIKYEYFEETETHRYTVVNKGGAYEVTTKVTFN